MSGHRRTGLTLAGLSALAIAAFLPPVAAADEPGTCEDLLVTHAPDGSSGATHTVAITSQALERGTEGWISVSWQVAATTELRTIFAISSAGVTELPPTATAAEGPVLELRFCGTSGSATAAGPETSEDAAGLAEAPTEGRPLGSPARARSAGGGAARWMPLGILGAAVGAAAGGVVLLLSRSNRGDRGVLG